jgi:hypothetical protein
MQEDGCRLYANTIAILYKGHEAATGFGIHGDGVLNPISHR